MSGRHSELSSHGKLAAEEVIRDVFNDMITFILGSQYVRVEGRSGVWKVVSGSGMGLLCSGELSDFVFYVMVEKDFVLCSEIREKYRIQFYGRFKDDLLILP